MSMDRRGFFRKSIFGLRDQAAKKAPEQVRSEIGTSSIDITILTEHPGRADDLCTELIAPHVTGRLLHLRRPQLEGLFPGGIVLFERGRRADYHDGISLLYAGLRQIETELRLHDMQSHPHLVRYTNVTPAFSRSVEVWHRDSLVLVMQLAEPGIYECASSVGPMQFEIREGRCRVLSASCAAGICAAQPAIIAPGERITCVPGEITAVIGAA